MLITYAMENDRQEISVVAESIPHLRRGAMRDFVKIMEDIGALRDSEWNRSTLTYTFDNGSFIEFFSADQADKLRGARRDVLFINEANNISWESYQQLSIRTRKFIYLDYNPTLEFWVHKELIGKPDTDFIVLTYRDNEALEPAIVKEIEKARDLAPTSEYWANWWRVYGLGEIGTLQGAVFSNWEKVREVPTDAKLIGYGLDFGFSIDPTALVEVRQSDKGIYLTELLYERELTNQDISKKLTELEIDGVIIADSAEPKSIEELRRLRWNIKPAKKGRDSILNSIDILLRNKIFITEESTNLIKEARGYVWDTDKTGQRTGKPIDDYNHCWDAVRYVALNRLSTNLRGSYTFR
jgi:phage terminase large subunit